jgi:hypothetical protein
VEASSLCSLASFLKGRISWTSYSKKIKRSWDNNM